MNKTKFYKLIFIIVIYLIAFTFLLISIKNYTSYLNTFKNDTHNCDIISTKMCQKSDCINIMQLKTNIFNTDTIRNNPYKSSCKNALLLQKKIAHSVLRFHVIANSDSEADQALKLKVRDSILHELQTGLSDISSIAQAKQYVASQFQKIENTSIYTIRENGYSYSVKAFIKKRYFPVKTYGDLTFPAGYYDALCVEIGKAAGHNWWCVLFPSLCFEDATTATVPDDSKKKLKDALTENEYNSLKQQNNKKKSNSETEKIQIHSGFYDLFH